MKCQKCGQNEVYIFYFSSTDADRCDANVDDEMTVRRQLNMEMRAAVEREDFEKAAELRDKIRGLEC